MNIFADLFLEHLVGRLVIDRLLLKLKGTKHLGRAERASIMEKPNVHVRVLLGFSCLVWRPISEWPSPKNMYGRLQPYVRSTSAGLGLYQKVEHAKSKCMSRINSSFTDFNTSRVPRSRVIGSRLRHLLVLEFSVRRRPSYERS